MGLIINTISPSLVEVEEGVQVLSPNIIISSFDKIINWARKSSLWPMTFGLA